MWRRTALGVGWSVIAFVACGGDGGASTYPEPATEKSATEPAAGTPEPASPEDPVKGAAGDKGPKEPAALNASPSCAAVGGRVVLKLGFTRDRRSVACYDVADVKVRFAAEKDARITSMGPMSDGFCALDVEVPKGAESGKIRVEIGDDAFESDVAFGVPCR